MALIEALEYRDQLLSLQEPYIRIILVWPYLNPTLRLVNNTKEQNMLQE